MSSVKAEVTAKLEAIGNAARERAASEKPGANKDALEAVAFTAGEILGDLSETDSGPDYYHLKWLLESLETFVTSEPQDG